MTKVKANGAEEPNTRQLAEKTVRRHMYGAFCAGLVPIPIMDIATLTAVQLNLVRKLTTVYDVPFSRNTVKNIVSSLLAGALPTIVGPYLASMLKAIPFLGFGLGLATVPLVAVAATYAVGQIFIGHFESGGTLLTFNTEKAKDLFEELLKHGMKQAAEMKEKIVPQTRDADPPEASTATPVAGKDDSAKTDEKKATAKKKGRSHE
ncbi:MAG: DUF697 domain-containing protein [Myxococcota bacterium]|nr:DUF697 domain-containing protein [Myxococcota bacterium]